MEAHSISLKPRKGLLQTVDIQCVVAQESMLICELLHELMEWRWLGGICLQVIEQSADRRVEPRTPRVR